MNTKDITKLIQDILNYFTIERTLYLILIVLILAFVHSIMKVIINSIKRRREIKIERAEQQQIKMMDQMLKPAEVSIKVVQEPLRNTIQQYLFALYNNNIGMLPTNLTYEVYQKTQQEIIRYCDIGIGRALINYNPANKFTIRQNNSSIYTVSDLTVVAKYDIEIYSEHVTFKKKIIKSVEQEFIFSGTNNDGWKLSFVGAEKIEKQQEYDV